MWFSKSFLPLSPKLNYLFSCLSRRTTYAAVLPSFIAADNQTSRPHSGVTALDGLRGIACLIVFNEHLIYNFTQIFLAGYIPGQPYWIIQWPFFRILWSGAAMVNVFFVISGYVLTYKPFGQLHERDFAGARTTLASATFRRAMRLYLPMWSAVMLCSLSVWLGLYNRAITVWTTENNIYRLHEGPPIHFNSLFEQLGDASFHAVKQLNVIGFKDALLNAEHYDLHTWTIPVELRSSMVLFISMLAVSQLKPKFRLLNLSMIALVLVYFQHQFPFLFIVGGVLADIDRHVQSMIQRQRDLDQYDERTSNRLKRLLARLLHPGSFLLAFLDTPGFREVT
ncbi:acyltransferase family-domain-containing protein [Xylariaceae sp. FL0255]|nr:acyltransferase family-domain-containing protein [Xylariaceae sp. FL0255]